MYTVPLLQSRHNPSNQRHVCVVSETYPPEVNGVALTLAHLVKGLAERDYIVSVVRPYRRTFDGLGGHGDIPVTYVRGLPLPGYKGVQFGLPAGGALRRSWLQQRPDVVYVATEGPLGWSAVCTARRLGIPVCSGFHTNFHVFSRYYRAGWLQSVIFRYLRRFHNRTSGTFVPSLDLCDRLQALGFHHVSVLGRGVDNTLFTPQRRCAELRSHWGVSENDLVILSVGRVAPEKNLPLAIAAYRGMQRFSNVVKFVIVGDGPLRAALQKEHPDLIFSGVHTGLSLARHYASADVFLFPSETETFGNVTLEALASGLAVVAYNYAAAKMHITHGETGILVPYGDAKAFIDLAVDLVRNPQSLHKIRRQARAHVATLSWQGVVARFEALLTSIMSQRALSPDSSITHRGLITNLHEGG